MLRWIVNQNTPSRFAQRSQPTRHPSMRPRRLPAVIVELFGNETRNA
jgi:hypothetical protein